jgi:hypothetical protein
MRSNWLQLGFLMLSFAGSISAMSIQAATLKLWTDVTTDGDVWTVIPHVTAHVGQELRYRISASKEGPSGRSQTNQSGRITVSSTGTGTLGSLHIGVGSRDHCDIAIEVFDGTELIGDITLQLPQ